VKEKCKLIKETDGYTWILSVDNTTVKSTRNTDSSLEDTFRTLNVLRLYLGFDLYIKRAGQPLLKVIDE
jgi:hypothetical protein